jgi:hypothetical protein
MTRPFVLTACVDEKQVGVHEVGESGAVLWHIPLDEPVTSGQHTVEVLASTWFFPHRFTRGGDFRPLAWRVESIRLCPAV